MSFKKSGNEVLKNAKQWKNNLTDFQKSKNKRREINNIEKPLSELCKIPKQTVILGRYFELAKTEKIKKKRCQIIANEMNDLWSKLNFPSVTRLPIERKVTKIVNDYATFLKFPKGRNVMLTFNKLCDITDVKGIWLSTEDKKLYELQTTTNGEVGYTTAKPINVHPSKATLFKKNVDKEIVKNTFSSNESGSDSSTSASEDEEQSNSSHVAEYKAPSRLKRVTCSTKAAVAMVTTSSVSTKKAAKICNVLAKEGIDVPTPSQSGVYRASIKEARKLEENYKTILKNEIWCLHFDGKKFGEKEVQAVVLTNEIKEVRVAVMVFENGKSLTIFEGVKNVLDKFDLWNSIKMIVCDTTNVNTGKKKGVVRLLQSCFEKEGLSPPQYIGCQHHVLDLILNHVMNEVLDGKSISPNISYDIFSELIMNYENLKDNFNQDGEKLKIKSIKWRDDMQFLYELGQVFKYYESNNKFPYINFKVLPSLSNARWNSRAILAILTFILIPEHRIKLLPICQFVCSAWYDLWFSDHRFRMNDFESLEKSVEQFNTAHKCFLKHWVKEDSVITNLRRSNICAERAIKVIQEIYPFCQSASTLNLKFISSNMKINK